MNNTADLNTTAAATIASIDLQPTRSGRKRKVLVADLFCGAGALSAAANDALTELGFKPTFIAVNHWQIACDTFLANHPGARVHCTPLEAAHPAQMVPEGRLDLLMAGIECTFFSRARGGKPVNDQQRMGAWHINHWCTALRVRRLLLENVPEFLDWGPVDARTGRPIPSRKGEYFRKWWKSMLDLGYIGEYRLVNFADFGDATTRTRLIMKFMLKSERKPITWPKPTHCKRPSLFGEARWRAAREVIDWSILGQSIYARKRPLAPATLLRIHAGLVRFKWPEPYLIVLRQHMAAQSIDMPLPTLTSGGTHVGLVQPFVSPYHGGDGPRAMSTDDPLPTQDTANRFGLVQPYLFQANQSVGRTERGFRSTEDPICTITATGTDLGLVSPASPAPWVLNQQAGGRPKSIDEPIPAIATDGAHALIAPYYGGGSGETCSSVNEPLPTATTKGRFGLIMSTTHSADKSGRSRSIDDPMPTITTASRGEHALLMPVTHADGGNRARSVDEPFPTVTGAHRGELAFITAAFGERPTQAPRTHSIDEPAPTVCAQGRINLAQAARDYDILFRMLQPHELAGAMSISEPGRRIYSFLGTKTDQIKLIGQAVPYRGGRAHVHALMSA